MRYSTDEKIDNVVRKLLSTGWLVKSSKRHLRIKSPTGAVLTVPGSPSCPRAALNWISQIRRDYGVVA
jgi:predicted RNA binding protein YcfA (HicA-like mRNA interferase family)